MNMLDAGAVTIALGLALSIAVALALHYWHVASRQRTEVASLRETMVKDPLTGLLNRRGFQERMEIELERAVRDGTPLCLVVADLDDFKEVNDRLGHLGGDMALERVSGVIAKTTRRADAAARLGGEEFAFILPDTIPHEAYTLAERVRTATERSFRGTAVELTVSLGVARFPQHGMTAEGLLHSADQAMYAAKALGKNRTALYEATRAELRDLSA
jgi:diguanylate cyclase (GGDEF)-like protein